VPRPTFRMIAAVVIGPVCHILQRGTAKDGLRLCLRARSCSFPQSKRRLGDPPAPRAKPSDRVAARASESQSAAVDFFTVTSANLTSKARGTGSLLPGTDVYKLKDRIKPLTCGGAENPPTRYNRHPLMGCPLQRRGCSHLCPALPGARCGCRRGTAHPPAAAGRARRPA